METDEIYDLVVDAVGTASSFATAVGILEPGGTVLLIGNLAHEVTLPLQTATTNEWTLVGTYAFDRQSFADAVALLPEFRDQLATFIGHRCRLEQIPETITAMAKGELRALKVVVDVAAGEQ